jgi:hypothetical protein
MDKLDPSTLINCDLCGKLTPPQSFDGEMCAKCRAGEPSPRLNMTYKEIKVRLVEDGDMWMAMIGKNLQEGCGAFAKTPKESLHLLSQHKEFDNWSNTFPSAK